MTDVPANAVDLAQAFEGFSATPYVCPAGHWTIGYGHLCAKDHPPITHEQGVEYLRQDMIIALSGALRYCPWLAGKEDVLGAITDFVFNLGAGRLRASTLRKRINEGDWWAARKELARWVYGGGRILRGLVLRRAAEANYLPKGGQF